MVVMSVLVQLKERRMRAYLLVALRAVERVENDQPRSFARLAFSGFPAAATLEPDLIVLIDVGVGWGQWFHATLGTIKLNSSVSQQHQLIGRWCVLCTEPLCSNSRGPGFEPGPQGHCRCRQGTGEPSCA